MKTRWWRPRTVAALGLSCALFALAGCAGGSSSGSGEGPIVIGGVFTLSPTPFGQDVKKTAAQVFENVNASGGINGRKIDYVTGDDQAKPSKAAAVAREAVGAGAVVMAGSASFVDCATNRGYYKKQGILAIEGVGVDPYCFNSPNIASVTVSPYAQLTVAMYYASEVLGNEDVCLFQPTTPGSRKAIEAAIQRWKDLTGKKLLIDDHNIPMNQTKFTNELLRAKSKGCDAVVYGGGDAVAAAMLQSAANQGMGNVDFLYVSVSYTKQLADAAGDLGLSIYATTGLYPFTKKSPKTKEWRQTAKEAGAQQTAFSEAGYVAAKWIVSVLKSIEGPITRESVTSALKSGGKYESPLVAVPLVFGAGEGHNRTSGINIMHIMDGQWQRVDTVSLPDSGN